jgi:RNA polymerase sigma factor (sigma-70 family)
MRGVKTGSRPVDNDIERLVIESARNGGQHAWRQLFAWHFDPVYRFAMMLARGRQDRAEEITQRTFVTAARRIRRFEPPQATFRAWLLGIARKHYVSLIAKESRRKRHESSAVKEDMSVPVENTGDLRVHEALGRLPHRYRGVLEAKYLHRRTLGEIAEAEGQSIEAIESLLRRAREKFAQVYEQTES